MEKVRDQPHGHELVVEVRQDLLEMVRILSRQRDDDLVDPPTAERGLHGGVVPDDAHAFDRAARQGEIVGEDADHAESGLRVRVDRCDRLARGVTRADDEHVTKVPAPPPDVAKRTAAGEPDSDDRDDRPAEEHGEHRAREEGPERGVHRKQRDRRQDQGTRDRVGLGDHRAGALGLVEAASPEIPEGQRQGEAEGIEVGRRLPRRGGIEHVEADEVGDPPGEGHQAEVRRQQQAAKDLTVTMQHP